MHKGTSGEGNSSACSLRFSLKRRLRSTAEFNTVRQHGRKIVSRFFILQFLALNQSSPGVQRFLAVVASRRVGNAVKRNRAKRLLREVFRKNPQKLPQHCAVVLTARPDILKAPYDRVCRDYNYKLALVTRPGMSGYHQLRQ